MYQRRLFLIGYLVLTFLEFRTLRKHKHSSDYYTLSSCGILLYQQRLINTHDSLYLWVFSLANFIVFLAACKDAPGSSRFYHRNPTVCFSIMVALTMFEDFDQLYLTHFPCSPVPTSTLNSTAFCSALLVSHSCLYAFVLGRKFLTINFSSVFLGSHCWIILPMDKL